MSLANLAVRTSWTSKALGCNSAERDLQVRKSLAWKALNGSAGVWSSSLHRPITLSFFSGMVESDLHHGCERWTLKLTAGVSGRRYTRMLCALLNIRVRL